jgi:signal transduction histidine kinase
MRDRLVVALVGITVAVIALYAVPRAYVIADLVQRQEVRKIERSVDLLAVLMEEREASGRAVTEDYLAGLLNEAEHIEYVEPDGTTVSAGEPPPGADSDISITRELDGGGTVTLARSGELVDQRVSDALIPLIVIGLGLLVAAALFGNLLALRLARPFSELAGRADQIGHGRFDVEIPHYKIPEAEGIGQSLRQAGAQLDVLLRREREFAVNASHQLRTPITALRLELEDVSLWPQTPPDVAEHLRGLLGELDRLSEAITELLDLARGHRLGTAVDLDLTTLTSTSARRWRERLAADGREIVREGAGPVPAYVAPGPVEQILDILIENALDHGAGTVTLETRDVGSHLQLRVRDEGAAGLGPEVFGRGVTTGGTGVGLAVATELAESLSGHLSVEETTPTCFVLRLPKADGTHAS